jgi:hypothetical protein
MAFATGPLPQGHALQLPQVRDGRVTRTGSLLASAKSSSKPMRKPGLEARPPSPGAPRVLGVGIRDARTADGAIQPSTFEFEIPLYWTWSARLVRLTPSDLPACHCRHQRGSARGVPRYLLILTPSNSNILCAATVRVRRRKGFAIPHRERSSRSLAAISFSGQGHCHR